MISSLFKVRGWYYFVLAALIIFILLFGGLAKTYLSEGKMGLIQTPLGQIVLGPYRFIRKIPDVKYIGYAFRKHNLPVYELKIDSKDLNFLNGNLPEPFSGNRLTDEYRQKVPAVFYHQGQEYKVEVRYRGNVSNHWANEKKSWDIEFSKKTPFNGLRGINLIIPEDRGIVLEHLNNYRAKKMGLYPLHTSFVTLRVNGKNHGVYFQVEPWDDKYLAKHELIDETDMYSFYEEWSREWPKLDLFEELSYLNKKSKNNSDQDDNYSLLNGIVDLLVNGSDEEFEIKIGDFIDLENFLAWQSHHTLSGSFHTIGRNMRFFIDQEIGKLVFVPWDVNISDPDPQLIKNSTLIETRISMIPEFAYQRNKILWDYVKDDKNLDDDLRFYDESFKEIKVALIKDRLKLNSTSWFFSEYQTIRQKIIDNFYNVKSALQDARASVVVYTDGGLPIYFDVTADTLPEISLAEVRLFANQSQFVDYRLVFDSNHDNVLNPTDEVIGVFSGDIVDDYVKIVPDKEIIMFAEKRYTGTFLERNSFLYYPQKYRFFLIPSNNIVIEKIEVKVNNAVTGERVESRIQYVDNNDYKFLALKNLSIDEFVNKYPIFKKIDSNNILLGAGTYNIRQDVVIPEDIKLTINPGTRLFLDPDVSIISYGSIVAVGTGTSPIVLSNANFEKPWGVLAISESNSDNIFKYVRFENGRDAKKGGVYYSGMLSAYRSDVIIENSEFSNAQADDALNVKHAQAKVIASNFSNNSSDAIDFDFIETGEISNNKFYNNGNDSIDISGSTILISNNYIENSNDKCISVGEKSLDSIVYNNILNGCNIGVEIKDLSEITIINNVIVNNQIGVNAYQKKEIFGGGYAKVFNSIFIDNRINVETDKQSKVSVYYSNLADRDGNDNFSDQPMLNSDFTVNFDGSNSLFRSGGNTDILSDKLDIELNFVSIGLNR